MTTSADVTTIGPQPGPQMQFASTPADIAIYGGEAGGGKSWALVYEALRHKDNPKFGGVVFRRTSPELTGPESLWAIANELYRLVGARPVASPVLTALFPAGGEMRFLHLQHESDVYDHQGKGYAYIGFDELTHFTEAQFWYMASRRRSTSGIDPYIRATCNPDPDSFVRKLIDWWIGPDGHAIPERCGVLRWFIRAGDALTWADTRDELLPQCTGDQKPLSMTFIHARLEDNPALTSKDPNYAVVLAALPDVERQRLRGGNWNIRPEAGKYLKREYFTKRWTSLPPLNIYAASDYAVKQKKPGREPDFTEHGIFGLSESGDLYVIDWRWMQETTDVWIETQLDMAAAHKPLAWFGEKGVIQAAIEPWLARRMRERNVHVLMEWCGTSTTSEERSDNTGFADSSKRAKAIRGRPMQAMASLGRIIFPANAPWVDRVIDQLVGFPVGHDDAFDVLAHMCGAIDEAHNAIVIARPVQREPGTDYRRPKARRSWKTA